MSDVIHFEGIFKDGKAMRSTGVASSQTVPYCTRWAMRPKWGQMTTDKSKVSCTRCAKQLGIEPAKLVETGNPTKTCQCCFGGFKTGKTVALHGFKRPGIGFLIGRCRGEGYLPYELSCEQTKVYRAELVAYVAKQNAYLARLENNEVNELTAEAGTDERNPRTYGTIYKTVKVVRGDVEKPSPFSTKGGFHRVPSFETLLEQEKRSVERNIKAAQGEIAFLTGKIDSWVLVG